MTSTALLIISFMWRYGQLGNKEGLVPEAYVGRLRGSDITRVKQWLAARFLELHCGLAE